MAGRAPSLGAAARTNCQVAGNATVHAGTTVVAGGEVHTQLAASSGHCYAAEAHDSLAVTSEGCGNSDTRHARESEVSMKIHHGQGRVMADRAKHIAAWRLAQQGLPPYHAVN